VVSLLDAYDILKNYKNKYDEVMKKLRNISVKGNTKYSVIIAVKENKIQTTPDDRAYASEVEAFHLRRIIEISIHVFEKQLQSFKRAFYPRYAMEIMKLKKSILSKNIKSGQLWEKIQNLIKI
jgi:hypothetical protein